MKENINFAFSIGLIAGLSAKLLDNLEIKKIEECKNKDEFFNILKKHKNYSEDYEIFEKEIDEDFNETIKELENVCPKTKFFDYIFCKNDFLNFKIAIKNKFSNIQFELEFKKPYKIAPEKILNTIETKDFSEIDEPFRQIFSEHLELFLTNQNQKLNEICLDEKMYETLLQLSNKEKFLEKRTKLEITLKNLTFCLRQLKYEKDCDNLEMFLIEGGLIEKEKIAHHCKKGLDEVCKLLSEIGLKDFSELFQKNSISYDEIIEEILIKFDENFNASSFSFVPIFKYITLLKKQYIFLKKKLIILTFGKIL